MGRPTSILLLEDNRNDAQSIKALMRDVEIRWVETLTDFEVALKENVDLVIASYRSAAFDGTSALRLARAVRPDVPFIFVSGTPGEEVAIDALKLGATDYVLKNRLSRLGPAVTQAMRELNERPKHSPVDDPHVFSECDLLAAIETIPAIVFMTAADGTGIWINKRWVEYTGLSREETYAGAWKDTLHPEDAGDHISKWEKCLATGGPFGSEARHRSAAGEYRSFMVRAVPLRADDGRIIRWYGTLTDIEDNKVAEQELRSAEQALRTTLDTIPALAVSIFPDNTVDYFNAYWLAQGFAETDLRSCGEGDMVHPDDLVEFTEHWNRAQVTGEPYEAEVRLRKADGKYRWYVFRANPLRDETGKVIKWYGLNFDIDDRKRAQDALQESERHLRQLTETIPEMLWSATPEGKIGYFNGRLLDYLGFETGEVADGDWWTKALHPEDVQRVRKTWQHSVETGEPYNVMVRDRRASDDTYRWCQARALPIRDLQGRISAWHGSLIDIHDRVVAEQKLRSAEQELKITLDTIPTLVVSAWPDGSPDFFNAYWHDQGFSADDLRDGPAKLIHPDDSQRFMEVWRKSIATGERYSLEARFKKSNGEYRWFLVRGVSVSDAHGKIIKRYATATDINDLKMTQQALEAREQELQQIIDAVPTPIWVVNADAEPTYISKKLRDWYGLDVDELERVEGSKVKGAVRARVHPDDAPAVEAAMLSAFATGKSFDMKYRDLRYDGLSRWVAGRAEPLRDDDGKILKWFGVVIDIDEEKRTQEALRLTEDRLRRASQIASLSELSASIAHEINQPLAAVKLFGSACRQWLSSDPPNVEAARASADKIIRNVDLTADVVSRVRALFKHRELTKTYVDLNEVVHEVCQLMSIETNGNKIRVELDLDDSLPYTLADRVQMQQVFVNIIRNGINAMQAVESHRKRIGIRTGLKESHEIVVEISDHGSGVDNPDMIFDPFFTTKEEGMGIGLSVCRTIVEAHEGKLQVSSNEPCGTIISVALPVRS